MKNRLASLALFLATFVLGSCATSMSNDPTAPSGPPAATVRIGSSQASYIGSASTGSGTIYYQGDRRNFSINGVGAGGIGVQNISASGKVYHLRSLADFPGTYTGARSGLTLGSGQISERFENENGTVIYLTGKTSGLALSMGIDKMVITLN